MSHVNELMVLASVVQDKAFSVLPSLQVSETGCASCDLSDGCA